MQKLGLEPKPGQAKLPGSARANSQSHPQTDLKELVHWDSFPDEIHEAILSAMTSHDLTSKMFDINGWTGDTIVEPKTQLSGQARASTSLNYLLLLWL